VIRNVDGQQQSNILLPCVERDQQINPGLD